MNIDTAGKPIREVIQNCDCGLTGGCEKCNPPLLDDLEMKRLDNWKKRFDFDLKERNKKFCW